VADPTITIHSGDCAAILDGLPPESVHCAVTSPPYWGLRHYKGLGSDQLGAEERVGDYIDRLVVVLRKVRRVLRKDGSVWLNVGDSYATSKMAKSNPSLQSQSLVGVPARLEIALLDDGWLLRSRVIWRKLNPLPESTRTRPTRSYEFVFFLARSRKHFYDAEAVQEPLKRPEEIFRKTPGRFGGADKHNGVDSRLHSGKAYRTRLNGRNLRDVWSLASQGYKGAHSAVFPVSLPTKCIKASTSEVGCCPSCGAQWERVRAKLTAVHETDSGPIQIRGYRTIGWKKKCSCGYKPPVPCTVLDPFFGAGTTGLAAQSLGRNCIGIELSDASVQQAKERLFSSGT